VANLDDPSVWSGALIRSILTGLLGEPADLLFGLGPSAILTPLGEVSDVFRKRLPPRDDVIGHVEDFLKLTVPCDEAVCIVEHGNAIAHVLERDAELVLPLREFGGPFTKCAEVGDAGDRDNGLFGKGLQQRDLTVGEAARLFASKLDRTNCLTVAHQWDG
jgi:hypothetical protein